MANSRRISNRAIRWLEDNSTLWMDVDFSVPYTRNIGTRILANKAVTDGIYSNATNEKDIVKSLSKKVAKLLEKSRWRELKKCLEESRDG